MEDMIIKGTGNSRYLKSVANIMTLYPTYESFATALANGTFPIDLNGINPAGVETPGTRLNKASLLTDTLCTALGLSTTATPTQAMESIRQTATSALSSSNIRARIAHVSYIGTNQYGPSHPTSITFSFPPKLVMILLSIKNNNVKLMFSSNYMSSYSVSWIACTDILTTSYTANIGIGGFGYSMTRKSSDGRTISWYTTYTGNDTNARMLQFCEDNTYHCIGIG